MSALFGSRRTFKRRGREVQELALSYQRIFNSPDGQTVLRDLFRATGYFEIAPDGKEVAANAKRQVAQHILSILELSEDDLRELAEQDYQEQVEMKNDE